jgi:hypothetical protein
MEKKEILPTLKGVNLGLKKVNRFAVEFPEKFNIKLWSVTSSDKPRFTNDEWENIKITFNDFIEPSTSQALFRVVNFLKTNKDVVKFEFKINSLDPTGVVVEQWLVRVKNVLTINFGELDYKKDSFQELTLIVKPLDCILEF